MATDMYCDETHAKLVACSSGDDGIYFLFRFGDRDVIVRTNVVSPGFGDEEVSLINSLSRSISDLKFPAVEKLEYLDGCLVPCDDDFDLDFSVDDHIEFNKEWKDKVDIISLDELTVTEDVTSGIFRVEYKGKDLCYKTVAGRGNAREAEDEITSLIKLNHPNIAKLLGLVVDNDVVKGYLLKYYSRRLKDCLHKLSYSNRVDVCIEVVETMIFFVRMRYFYSDLKTSNIMLENDLEVRFIDFGGGFTDGKFDPSIKDYKESMLYTTGVFLRDVLPEFDAEPLLKRSIDFESALDDLNVFRRKTVVQRGVWSERMTERG